MASSTPVSSLHKQDGELAHYKPQSSSPDHPHAYLKMPTDQRGEFDNQYIKHLEAQNRYFQQYMANDVYPGAFPSATPSQSLQQGQWVSTNLPSGLPSYYPPFQGYTLNPYPPLQLSRQRTRDQNQYYQESQQTYASPVPPLPALPPPPPRITSGTFVQKLPKSASTSFPTSESLDKMNGMIDAGTENDSRFTNEQGNVDNPDCRSVDADSSYDRNIQSKIADGDNELVKHPAPGQAVPEELKKPSTSAPRYVRTVVKKYDGEEKDWTEVEDDLEKSRDALDQFVLFRREMDPDNPKKVYHEEIEIHSLELKSLVAEADEWWRDTVAESSQPLTIEEPFESFVWNWDRFVKISEPQDDDQLVFKQARRALQETLQKLKHTATLQAYFRSREQIISSKKIKFDQLWTLFGHGSVVYARSYMKQLQMFEVQSCSLPEYTKRFRVSCSAFDWDGSNFCAYTYHFYIKEFSGEIPVQSLEVFPTEFYQSDEGDNDDTALKYELLQRGRKYAKLCTTEPTNNQCHYKVPVIVTPSNLHRLATKGQATDLDLPYSDLRSSIFDGVNLSVTSIDFKGNDSKVIIDSYAFINSERNTMKHGNTPPLGFRVPDQNTQCVCGRCKGSLLQRWRPGLGYGQSLLNLRESFSEESKRLLFLPPRLLGFAFKEKLWGQFLVDNLESATFSASNEHLDPFWKELQLEEESKELLIAYVMHHKAPSSRSGGQDPSSIDARAFDVIKGKGQGLVILLHGPPGVGKTLTAEAVALVTHKPLLTLSVAEMGLEAQEAERKLTDIFSDAARWEAILLMDEADVFVEERMKGELERNALVSVLLRCLEYYDGIIILTTNRIRSIDAAVQSRVHLAIQYHDLSASQRVAIFKNRLRWIPDDEIEDRKNLEKGLEASALGKRSNKANGRQVRNIVIGARALAKRKNEKLTLDHLMTVYETTVAFIDGMADLVNKQRAMNEAPS